MYSPFIFIVMIMSNFQALFWNCRRCGHPRFCNFLREYRRDFQPDLVALFETRISGKSADTVVAKLGFDDSPRVQASGFSGGIWLLWSENIRVEILQIHPQFLHLRVFTNGGQFPFLCTAVYASPHPHLRNILWKELGNIAVDVKEPWIMARDFNAILRSDE